MTWLYDIGLSKDEGVDKIEAKLRRAGEAGWELVAVVVYAGYLVHYFRHDGSGGRPRPAWI